MPHDDEELNEELDETDDELHLGILHVLDESTIPDEPIYDEDSEQMLRRESFGL